ncbi:RNA-directed DNA polymerase [Neorhodopirellula lusitana]|uniref:RNA-directed DNA polymerase n=1 Tax=Neorhodopirellula lusitana TaxID=445327 RepID=A0ABY1QA73_9BACT|nr:reverse transcriptase family protein [Neorhodopirellula lusitana]SMP63851.1 RNA-directed DNA polymerase [Neorhodopirellula lusitana]
MNRRSITHRELCNLISHDLSARWLGDEQRILRRLKVITGSRAGWVSELAVTIHREFGRSGYCLESQLAFWLWHQPLIKRAFGKRKTIEIDDHVATQIDSPAYRWDVPRVSNQVELADLLCVRSPETLDWLTLPHIRRETKVDHYRRRVLPKRDGRERLIEEPRPVLKRVQRIIAREILIHVPLHDAAHAYRPSRSVQTCAAPHAGQRVVLKMDLQDFFGGISCRRVSALFRHAGYDREVSLRLARLCTAPPFAGPLFTGPLLIDPSSIVAGPGGAGPGGAGPGSVSCSSEGPSSARCMGPSCIGSPRWSVVSPSSAHLPQGAPSSPGIANAVAYQMDRRLAGLAASLSVSYTRYADDLYFSGDASFGSRVDRFATTVAVIAMEEGFGVNFRKTRKMFNGHRQNVLGLTVNEGINSDRKQYETLKAILFNCRRNGWRSQNRDNHPHFAEHLRGRIASLGQANPGRGAKLLAIYNQVDWG